MTVCNIISQIAGFVYLRKYKKNVQIWSKDTMEIHFKLGWNQRFWHNGLLLFFIFQDGMDVMYTT